MVNLESLKNKKVLYVEDDLPIMKSFSKILLKIFSEVLLAENGKEGLEVFKENQDKIDFIITDIKMPRLDGLDMFSEIKKINSNVPCIITTAHAEKDYFEKAENIGVHKYITKPLNINDLLETISEIEKEKQA
jgi:YesN/AraC family two-component response regulator